MIASKLTELSLVRTETVVHTHLDEAKATQVRVVLPVVEPYTVNTTSTLAKYLLGDAFGDWLFQGLREIPYFGVVSS